MLFNVDFDGVIVTNTYEDNLFSYAEQNGLSFADTSPLWDWYSKSIQSTLPLNVPLLKELKGLKNEGHVLRLWTDRAYTLRTPTLNNLEGWKGLFDSFYFYSGKKASHKVEGVVIDNHHQNLKAGAVGGIYYPTF